MRERMAINLISAIDISITIKQELIFKRKIFYDFQSKALHHSDDETLSVILGVKKENPFK